MTISPELAAALDRAREWDRTATPQEKAAMWAAQRESWLRAMGPCKHANYDWETCPQCLQEFADRKDLENKND
jgi:hypothetical protein